MFKTGNAVILRGSSSAIHSNKAIVSVIHRALKQTSLPSESVQLIEDTTRDSAKQLFTLNEYLDVLIPRGGKQLIDTVVREASVPVLETGAGNCHIFIDETADKQMAFNIIINAKHSVHLYVMQLRRLYFMRIGQSNMVASCFLP